VELHDEGLVQLTALMVVMGGLLALAPTLRVPFPILLVLGGLAIAFVPGLPRFELPPDLVLIGFLPPLLYAAAFFTPLRELRRNVRPIATLAIGVVAATMAGVAVVAHYVADLPWAAAFVLGAVVSPTDPIAATSIASRLGAPRRGVAIVEGEALVNDATALVFYRTAVAAAVAGTFSLVEAAGELVLSAVGGILIGLAVGFVVRQVRLRIDHPPTEITISLLTGYLAYLPAEALGLSAVLAVVTVGVYMGWYTPELTTAETRLQGVAFWSIFTFALNAILFTLVGLQLPSVLDGLDAWMWNELLVSALAVCAAVVLIRFLLTVPFAYLPPALLGMRRRGDDAPAAWREGVIVSWSGLRGAVSLAAALAIPLSTDTGAPFPGRELIIFLAFAVILFTLVVQGLSLPFVIRAMHLEDDDSEELEEAIARKRAAQAALRRIEELVDEDWVREETAERMRGLYNFRISRFGERLGHGDGGIEEQSQAYQRLRRELLRAEEEAVVALRRQDEISDEVLRRVLRDLALEDVRLDVR
jgi:CPA1 family monovalent cation:H+ antiporter